jgi:hypothetical protein
MSAEMSRRLNGNTCMKKFSPAEKRIFPTRMSISRNKIPQVKVLLRIH